MWANLNLQAVSISAMEHPVVRSSSSSSLKWDNEGMKLRTIERNERTEELMMMTPQLLTRSLCRFKDGNEIFFNE